MKDVVLVLVLLAIQLPVSRIGLWLYSHRNSKKASRVLGGAP